MIREGTCPECGAKVGSDPGIDPYKHAINCLHLAEASPDRMIDQATQQSVERGERTRALMAMAFNGGAAADRDAGDAATPARTDEPPPARE